MSEAALPDWLDPEFLRLLIVAVLVVVAFLLYIVLRFVRRLVAKVVLLVLLVGLGVSLWVQRADLEDCALTCECTLYGQEVVIPVEQLPENLRTIDANGDAGCSIASEVLSIGPEFLT
ncbi:MAG: hypothetical protein OXB92_06955 [Acidimicrobiaceae bacterium]|nr:hypothetical protein [Acidimicrobiia bacterium]MCY4493574.1 hypothetical protein [Acidimicrobiaceae bacterium]